MSTYDDAVRRALLTQLVEWAQPVAKLRAALVRLPWDVQQPIVTLERRHVEAAVDRVRNRHATLADLLDWADAVECRDDLGRDQVVRELVHVLANPTLFAITNLVDVERELASRFG